MIECSCQHFFLILDPHNTVLPGQALFTVLDLVTLATNSQAGFKKK